MFSVMIPVCAVIADESPVNVEGTWSITLTFIAGEGHHTAIFEQQNGKLTGVYKGEYKEGTLRGTVEDNTIDFTGYLKHEATGLRFQYTGTVEGDTMEGEVDMGEYWKATWTAEKKKPEK